MKNYQNKCEICNNTFIGVYNQKVCSNDCRKIKLALNRRLSRKNDNLNLIDSKLKKIRICSICKKEYLGHFNSSACSFECKKIRSLEFSKKAELIKKIKKKSNYNYSKKAIKANETREFNKKIKESSINDLISEFGNLQ